jgi:hypothetical protein
MGKNGGTKTGYQASQIPQTKGNTMAWEDFLDPARGAKNTSKIKEYFS